MTLEHLSSQRERCPDMETEWPPPRGATPPSPPRAPARERGGKGVRGRGGDGVCEKEGGGVCVRERGKWREREREGGVERDNVCERERERETARELPCQRETEMPFQGPLVPVHQCWRGQAPGFTKLASPTRRKQS